jgi:ribulose-phosphate 3-epimerase
MALPHILPSIIAADFSSLKDAVARISGADGIHVDVMDGVFVPNITIGPLVVAALRRITPLPLDVHLMIVHPERYVGVFADAGADAITVHQEACAHLHGVLQAVRERGKKAGVSLNPITPVSALECALPFADQVLVMGVNPGFSGQKLIPETVEKVAVLNDLRRRRGLLFRIAFDGGITADNIRLVLEAGCDLIVAGSAVFDAPDPTDALRRLKTP